MQLSLFSGIDLSVWLLSSINCMTVDVFFGHHFSIQPAMCRGLLRGFQATAEFHGTSWPWVSMDWSIPCNCTKSWQLPQWAMAWNCHSLATHRKEEELLIKHRTLIKPALTSVPFFLDNDSSANIPGLLCLQAHWISCNNNLSQHKVCPGTRIRFSS